MRTIQNIPCSHFLIFCWCSSKRKVSLGMKTWACTRSYLSPRYHHWNMIRKGFAGDHGSIQLRSSPTYNIISMKHWQNVSMYLAHSLHESSGITFSETEWERWCFSMIWSVWDGNIVIRNTESGASINLWIGIHDCLVIDIGDLFPNPRFEDMDTILSLIYRICSNSSSAIYPKKGNRQTR